MQCNPGSAISNLEIGTTFCMGRLGSMPDPMIANPFPPFSIHSQQVSSQQEIVRHPPSGGTQRVVSRILAATAPVLCRCRNGPTDCTVQFPGACSPSYCILRSRSAAELTSWACSGGCVHAIPKRTYRQRSVSAVASRRDDVCATQDR